MPHNARQSDNRPFSFVDFVFSKLINFFQSWSFSCSHAVFSMNTTTVQTSWVSSHDLYWEHKMEKRKRSTIITLSGIVAHFAGWIGEFVIFFSFYFLSTLQSDINSNRVYVLGHKYVLGPSQTHFSPRLAAKNIFMPANINSIVILERILLAWWVGIKKWTRNYCRSAKLLTVYVLAVVDVFLAPY